MLFDIEGLYGLSCYDEITLEWFDIGVCNLNNLIGAESEKFVREKRDIEALAVE
jgi:hypothetical protein